MARSSESVFVGPPGSSGGRPSTWSRTRVVALAALAAVGILVGADGLAVAAEALDPSCTLSALNRSGVVSESGSWVIPNVPANVGKVRIRATCVRDGVVRHGESDFITIPANGILRVSEIDFGATPLIATSLALSSPRASLGAPGDTVQLVGTATYSDGTTADVTASTFGTDYRSSNAAIASVDAEGLVTARGSGRVLISSVNEGALAMVQLTVATTGDSDGDGLPDDWEIARGLDPRDPLDAQQDQDGDGLTALEEFGLGTEPRDADSDDDGLSDGAEVDERGTNPLLGDTDGDGIWDGLEVDTGSNPLDGNSFDLAAALVGLEMAPTSFTLVYNAALGEASRRVRVDGRLRDGRTLDVTGGRYGTAYTSSDLTIASFSAESGRVFAGRNGVATITATTAGFTATATVTVQTFTPRVLSSLRFPKATRSVALADRYAYVAVEEKGLYVVDVGDPAAPVIVGSVATSDPRDVTIEGTYAYVADGSGGLRVIDVSQPDHPAIVATIARYGAAAVAVRGTQAFVGSQNRLYVIDVTNPRSPRPKGNVVVAGQVRGIDFDGIYAVVAASEAGVAVVDVADADFPRVVGTTPTGAQHPGAVGIAVSGRLAYVADGGRTLGGLRVVDFRDPTNPFVAGTTSDRFGLVSVAIEGKTALTADYFFVNAVPAFNLATIPPAFDAVVDFAAIADDDGTDVAARGGIVYLTAGPRLYIGRYAILADTEGVAPTVEITAPSHDTPVYDDGLIAVAADVTDDFTVARVDFYVDGQRVFSDFGAPYGTTVLVGRGVTSVRIGVVAVDGAGNQRSVEDVFAVEPNPRLSVTLLSPAPGASVVVRQTLTLAAHAASEFGVTRVDFFLNGSLVYSARTPPYRHGYQLGNVAGRIGISATAYDGHRQPVSTETVHVDVLDDAPPFVEVIAPRDGARIAERSVFTTTVGASDDVGIDWVELVVDGQVQFQQGEPPYQWELSAPRGATEMHIAAVAHDLNGHETTSPGIVVHVGGDPDTTAVGTVVDAVGLPIANARVTCLGESGTSAADGTFVVAGVPTLLGLVECEANVVGADGRLATGGSQPAEPVAAGVTDVGDVVVAPLGSVIYPNAQVPAGAGARVVRVADLDDDGVADLVTANEYDGTLSIARGVAAGGFEPTVSHASGDGTRDVVVADFNGDDVLDLAAANQWTNDVAVFLGADDGTFADPVAIPVAGGPIALAAGTLDGNGTVDLAVTRYDDHSILVLLGAGDGTFTEGAVLDDREDSTPESVAIVDVTNDGSLDVLSGTGRWFAGIGDGLFAAPQDMTVSHGRVAAAADLDGDGIIDLVATEPGSLRVVIQRGIGGGAFAAPSRLDLGAEPIALTLARMTPTGSVDILVTAITGRATPVVFTYTNSGTGSFPTRQASFVGDQPLGLAVTDIDGDGFVDIATANSEAESVSVLYGFFYETDERIATSAIPRAVATGDLDGDGAPDLVVTGPQGVESQAYEISVLLGRGTGAFLPEQRYSAGNGPTDVALGDLDGDGDLDAAIATTLDDAVTVLFGVGDGTFGDPAQMPVGARPEAVVVVDLDGDGRLDVVAANRGENTLSILRGIGAGVFLPEQRVTVGTSPSSIAVGDLNGDLVPDLVVTNQDQASDMSVLIGVGDGTFAVEERLLIPGISAVLADVDGDGNVDLVTLEDGARDVVVLLGFGDGTLGAEHRFPVGRDPARIAVRDLDGDARPDIVATNSTSGNVSVLFGNGDGTFQPQQIYGVGASPEGVALVDLDADTLLDLVCVNGQSRNVSILFHR